MYNPTSMRAVVAVPGPPENAKVAEVPFPQLSPGMLLVHISHTAVNRADTLQRKGLYPPPPGASDILGLELSGIVAKVGEGVEGFKEGDRVMCLVTGGSYAEFCLADAATTMKLPDDLSFREAAAIPEVWLTAYQLLHFVGKFQRGETVLIHAGASSVGLAAIQLVREQGGIPIATASTKKLGLLRDMGVTHAIDYTQGSFVEAVLQATGGKGVDVVLCCVGASNFQTNLEVLAKGGRYVLYGLMSGGVVPDGALDLKLLMKKMLTITATTLRGRPLEYKARLVQAFWTAERAAKFVSGEFETNIHTTMDWREVAAAHAMMERNENAGKIILEVNNA